MELYEWVYIVYASIGRKIAESDDQCTILSVREPQINLPYSVE